MPTGAQIEWAQTWLKNHPCRPGLSRHEFRRQGREATTLYWRCVSCDMEIDGFQAELFSYLERYNPEIVSVQLRDALSDSLLRRGSAFGYVIVLADDGPKIVSTAPESMAGRISGDVFPYEFRDIREAEHWLNAFRRSFWVEQSKVAAYRHPTDNSPMLGGDRRKSNS